MSDISKITKTLTEYCVELERELKEVKNELKVSEQRVIDLEYDLYEIQKVTKKKER